VEQGSAYAYTHLNVDFRQDYMRMVQGSNGNITRVPYRTYTSR